MLFRTKARQAKQSTGFFGARDTAQEHFMVDFVEEITSDIYAWCHYLKFSPTWQQKQLLDAVQEGRPNIAVRSGQGPGKCLEDSLILTKNGKRWLSDLAGRDGLGVWSMDEKTEKTHSTKARCFESGSKPCVEVKADAGQAIRLSTDHPVYTQRGWVHAGELTTKDLMAMPRELPWTGTEEVSAEEARLIGYMLGDGSYVASNPSPSFTHLPEATLDDFLHCCDALGISYRRDAQRSKAETYALRRESIPVLSRWIPRAKSKHKSLPDRFWSLEKTRAAQMITALWICDGYFHKDGLEITLASERLIDDLQTAFIFWGIHSRKKYKKAKCKGRSFDAWKLSISGQESILLFADAFITPFIDKFPRFQEGVDRYLLPILEKSENTNTDIVPYNDVIMKEMADELGVSATSLRGMGFRGRDYAWLSRAKFRKMVETTGYTGKYAKWASNNIYWVRVESVEDRGTRPVYDLEVPGYGNFVAENLIVHNTATDALVVPWWLLKHPYSLGVITAPTMRQCKNVWLSEAQARIQSGDPRIKALFSFTGTGFGILGCKKDVWGAYLATASRPEAFQGIHRENLLMLCEESSGIPQNIMDTIKGTMSGAEGTYLWLQIGNPNSRSCAFFDCFNSLAGKPWYNIHWNGEETPETKWFSKRRNEEIADEFGKDSDVYRVRVLGEFPHTDPSCLINEDDLLACTKDDARKQALQINVRMKPIRKQIGIDLARFGGDENVITLFSGNMMLKMEPYQRTDPNAAIDRAVLLQEHMNWKNDECTFIVDTSGMGEMAAGMIGSQRRMGRRLHEFYSQNTANESAKYANKITEAWCLFAKEVRKRQIYLKHDKKLFQQLSNRLYSVDKQGRIKIETKDEYKKRNKDSSDGELGQSPDRADAVVMGYYSHAIGSSRVITA